ncbi:MAG: carbohydrate ABC transporter permease [Planctomycetes bacterium]|nr:carbohydrate ABC transporter permease [Planctomycetota bacterium]MCW8140205.1 carbohydrate ABC transporter permease [Planctomycetota bacterium]
MSAVVGRSLLRDRAGLALLCLIALSTLVPFVWALSMSLKPEESVFQPGIVPTSSEEVAVVDGREVRVRLLRRLDDGRLRLKIAEPGERRIVDVVDDGSWRRIERVDVRWENYPEAWGAYPFLSFGRAYVNSLVVAGLVTLGQVLTSALAAYAFARLRFPGRDVLFFGYLATMMVPGAVTMIPTFVLLKNLPDGLNWLLGTDYFSRQLVLGGNLLGIDSYFALIMPRCFSAYGTFMLRQYFLGVPRELEEAAYLDGCSSFGVLRHVCLPLAKPALATLAIFTFMWAWGDFFWPLIVTRSDEIKTLPLLLQAFQGSYGARWNLLMAASVMGLLPMLVVFLIGQRHFIEGIKLGAVKG